MGLTHNTKMLEAYWPLASGKSGNIIANGCNTLVNWKGTYEVMVI